ncbi:MAG: class I SAM-dependent methyltransferase [Helicobacter sp.]|uniref:class I SAM-dependent methyltransferase n=1 Tax=Helicobacter sp. TaxID=218 RepID=UPI003752D49D|nr:class I SAM-dependent methyltransferase [Helicobacter sp.]
MTCYIKDLLRKPYRKLQQIFGQVDFVPSGHFYSPIANDFEIQEGIKHTNYDPDSIQGINLYIEDQRQLLNKFGEFYKQMPFKETKQSNMRYYFDNNTYCHSDGICLYSMIRYLNPKRIIEVGSGFSSALMHDVNDIFFKSNRGGGIDITHIEPYPKVLANIFSAQEFANLNLHKQRLQEVPLTLFDNLEANDILFIDSTHVSKINSDVNRLFFEILPRLKSGVYIHLHDIFYPFTYPDQWLQEKRSWNEVYILRAFLQFNTNFKIIFFNTCLNYLYPDDFAKILPLSQNNTGGSIWIQKQ